MRRIISQNGFVDIPYEYSIIYIDNTTRCRICAFLPHQESDLLLGDYDSEQNATIAMHMMHSKYWCRTVGDIYVFKMPSDEQIANWKEE